MKPLGIHIKCRYTLYSVRYSRKRLEIFMRHFILISGICVAAGILPAAQVFAQNSGQAQTSGQVQPVQVQSAQAEGPLYVGMDGPEIIRLDADAASVVVGNPTHAAVTMDDSRTLMINPLAPGMTRIVVIGREGQVVMDRRVVIGARNSGQNNGGGQFITIKNACINSEDDCQNRKVYYCMEGEKCHDVAPMHQEQQSGGDLYSEVDVE